MKHYLLTHHPLLLPLAALGVAWTPIYIVAPTDARWVVLAFAFNGIITVGAAWLLLRQYIGKLIMASQGYQDVTSRMSDLEEIHKDELLELKRKRLWPGGG